MSAAQLKLSVTVPPSAGWLRHSNARRHPINVPFSFCHYPSHNLSFPVNVAASLAERLDFFQNKILLLEHNNTTSLAGQFYSIHPYPWGH